MGKQEEIRKTLRDFAAKVGPASTLLGVVKSVQKSDYTCTITDDDDDTGLDYEEVRLRPVLDDTKGLTIFPKEGTWALAVRIENEEDWMLLACGEVESIELEIESVKLKIDKDAIKYERGNLKIEADTKILLKVGSKSVGAVMNTFFTKLASSQVLTPAGPGTFKPDTITDINTAKTDLASILKS